MLTSDSSMSAEDIEERSQGEMIAFKTLEIMLLFTRFIVLLFFAIQTFKHIKKNGG